MRRPPPGPADSARLPSALDPDTDLVRQLKGRQAALFLDYDGTLTPIVARPELAVLDETVRRTLVSLAARCPVAIVSGRDRADVQRLVGLDELIYAGSHGFDIRGPGLRIEHGSAFLPDLNSAEAALRLSLARIPGALLERKTYALAVHVRGLAPDVAVAVEAAVDAALSRHIRLRKGSGNMVFELLPRLDWHKGKAVLHILEALRLPAARVLPIFIGDDRTDEDAFAALTGRGTGILVTESPRRTAAYYTLRDPGEVHRFLQHLVGAVGPPPP